MQLLLPRKPLIQRLHSNAGRRSLLRLSSLRSSLNSSSFEQAPFSVRASVVDHVRLTLTMSHAASCKTNLN
jgi:hypothetical protein